MSNFLPSPNDPEYPARVASLKEYRESLHARYPPVCEKCSPAVEDQIRRKDHMARTKALGAWLNDSKGRAQQRRVSEGHREPEKVTIEVVIWRLRGSLWATTFFLALLCNLAAWDPTYLSFQRAKRQGRDAIRLHQPPSIRLLDTNAHKSNLSQPSTPHSATREGTPINGSGLAALDPDFFTALSLSSKPVIIPTNPVFGFPSLVSSNAPLSHPPHYPDEMDWTPTDETLRQPDDASWLRPQRFFPPEKATGLEGLFERTLLVDDSPSSSASRKPLETPQNHFLTWWWAYLVFLVPTCAMLYHVQESRGIPSRPFGAESTPSF
ncbi:hypothetical protein H0H93_014145 [Arthromyces matolae]|nr:hypothetical protein H0H93_014145 [Arthromyces matolae]